MYREQWKPAEIVFNFSFREGEFLKITSACFFRKLRNTVQTTRAKYEFSVNCKPFDLFPIHIKTKENIYERKKSLESFS